MRERRSRRPPPPERKEGSPLVPKGRKVVQKRNRPLGTGGSTTPPSRRGQQRPRAETKAGVHCCPPHHPTRLVDVQSQRGTTEAGVISVKALPDLPKLAGFVVDPPGRGAADNAAGNWPGDCRPGWPRQDRIEPTPTPLRLEVLQAGPP